MFIANCNFDAGSDLKFRKGEEVNGDKETLNRLLGEGLISEVESEGSKDSPQAIEKIAPVNEEVQKKTAPVKESSRKSKRG